MTWEDRSPAERQALKQRRRARRERATENEQVLWARKRAAIQSPADRAVFEFDLARKRISGMATGERDAAWTRLARLLEAFNGGDGE